MSLHPYSEYKASGVDWLGNIPTHWEVYPHRSIFTEIIERGYPDEEMLSVTISQGIIRQAQLLSNSSKKDSSNTDKSKYKLVSEGDIAYNKMRAWQGAIGASDYRGIISPAYIIVRLRENQNYAKYFHYLFRTPLFTTEAERWSYGITSDQWSLRYSEFKQIYSPIPPPDEQDAIVRFLDAAEKRIRRYIRAKQKLIKVLNEQKQAIIQQAVTRGLNPDASMKDSGVEWLGEIPEHWKTIKLKFLVSTLGGMTPSKSEEKYWDGDIPWVSPKDMKVDVIKDSQDHITQLAVDETNISIVPSGSLLMVVRGMILARRVPVAVTACPVTINQDMKALVAKSSLRSDYLRLMFQGLSPVLLFFVEESGHGTRKFPTENWANLQLPIPSVDEQEYLLEHIQISTSELDDIIKQNEDQIDLIREYRTRLIADVVTGKIDVRGLAFEMPEEFGDNDLLDVDEDDLLEEDEFGDLENAVTTED